MGKRLVTAAAAALFGFSSPAFAATLVTSAKTLVCGFDCTINGADISALQPFNSSLGTLTGITLGISSTSTTVYSATTLPFDGSPHTGTAHLSYDSMFNALVNGTTYSFDVSNQQDISFTGLLLANQTFVATGSGTFVLDPAVFASFTDQTNICQRPVLPFPSGICVGGQPQTLATEAGIVASSSNLSFFELGAPPYTMVNTVFTLTYSYTPSGVPEPAAWAMMLLGFALIGISLRRRRRVAPADVRFA